MHLMGHASNVVLCMRSALFSLPVDVLQYQGAFILGLFSVGWAWSSIMRRRERIRLAALLPYQEGWTSDRGPAGSWPGVSVVMPVKGCRPHSVANWTSQIQTDYAGPLEFLFVVEHESDLAVPAINQVLDRHPKMDVHIHVAGFSESCSQKAFNLQSGISQCSAASKYVLCLDDDVSLHPSTISMLVDVLERDPTLFMATGYPFDIPPARCGLLTYCVLVYHLPLLIAFSLFQRTRFVWGGCMMLRLGNLRGDKFGILQAWREGGYSDDLTLASQCTQHGLAIAVPSFAVFPQWLEASYSWPRYWNYLRRQLYVLDTYADEHNRRLNHTMMWLHATASAALSAPLLTGTCQVAVWGLSCCVHWFGASLTRGHFGSVLLHPAAQGGAGAAGAVEVAAATAAGDAPEMLPLPLSAMALAAALLLAQCCLYWMTAEILLLFRHLSPKSLAISIHTFVWWKVWAALLLENVVLPACMLYTYLCPHVTWSGITYFKQRGRVVHVSRMT